MSRSKFLLIMFFSLSFFQVSAEEPFWVIAAESFTAENIPSVYADFPAIIPQLILSNIGGINSRDILYDEKKERQLQNLSDANLKLIRERSVLILEKDRILLSSDSNLVRQKKKNEAQKKITAKEKEIRAEGEKIKKLLSENFPGEKSTAVLQLWKSGSDLYKRTDGVTLSTSLKNNAVSGLITGTLEDISGYLFVTVQLETGIQSLPVISVSEAAPYEDIETLAASLTARLLPQIANRKPVTLQISVIPENARVFIDGKFIEDTSLPATVFAGEHIIEVDASGYLNASKTYLFENSGIFKVKVALEKEPSVSVGFDTGELTASLFINTRYFGETPQTVTIPSIPSVGEAVALGIQTYFIYRPDFSGARGDEPMTVKTNKVTTAKRIEKQRSVLYWSLGALYISLPFSMFSYGISLNKYQAYEDEKLEQTDALVTEITNWSNAATVTRGISIALGLNFFFQLARYFIAAEQATPQDAE